MAKRYPTPIIPNGQKCYKFYKLTEKTLKKMARSQGISTTELKKYYSHTDQYCDFYQDLSGIPRIFAQMLFHVQNATMISNIVKFEKNYTFLKKITKKFVPADFLAAYPGSNRIKNLLDDLKYDEVKNEGLVWNSKNSEKRPDAVITRFAEAMFYCAEYLKDFSDAEEVFADLYLKYTNNDIDGVISYFREEIKSGFSVALTCDFLKEFDTRFEFLPKPDVHIKDVVSALNGRDSRWYSTEIRELLLIKEMQKITEEINKELAKRNQQSITVYQLDRMIWLVCSGKFFIHIKVGAKDIYIAETKKL